MHRLPNILICVMVVLAGCFVFGGAPKNSNRSGGEFDFLVRSHPAILQRADAASDTQLARSAVSEDETRPYGVYDGRGGYLLSWLRGSNYAGYGGTDQILGRSSVSRPAATETLATLNISNAQEETVIAVGRGQQLIIWQDLRNGMDYDVYGARVSDDGRVLDPNGFLIAGGPGNQISPTVIFNGTEYLVAWSHFEGVKYIIRSAKVSVAAQVSSVTLEAARNDQHCLRPILLMAGNGIWLFWAEARASNRFMAKQLSTGQEFPILLDSILGGKFVAVTNGRYVLLAVSIVQGKFYDPADVLGVIWDTEKKSIVPNDAAASKIFHRIGSGPRPGVIWIEDGSESPRKRQFDGNIRGLQVGWDGKNFLVVWSTVIFSESGSTTGRATNHLILTRRIDPASGGFLGQDPKVVLQSSRPLRNPYLLSDGKGQLVLLYDTETEQGKKVIQSALL
jgi:hypothetical protein